MSAETGRPELEWHGASWEWHRTNISLATRTTGKRTHAVMDSGLIPPVTPFDCSSPEKWEQWKRGFDYYLVAANITDEGRKVALLLHMGGSELQELFYAISEPDVKIESLKQAIAILDKHLLPRKNVIYERHVFRRETQRQDEGVDAFVARLRKLSRSCEYGVLQEDMIRDQVVDKCCSHKLRCALLREPQLTLTSAVSIARTFEEVNKQAEVMESDGLRESSIAEAQAVSHSGQRRYSSAGRKREEPVNGTGEREKCSHCGRRNHDSENCFSQNRKCFNCGKVGHLQNMCRQPRQNANRSHAHVVTERDDHVFGVTSSSPDGRFPVRVGDVTCEVLIDSGATCNVMGADTFRESFKGVELQPGRINLYSYASRKPMRVLGKFEARVSHDGGSTDAVFYVIPGSHVFLLGKETSEKLDLLRVGPQVRTLTSADTCHVQRRPDLFKGLGKLKDFQLQLPIDRDVKPVAQKLRRVPFSVQPAVEAKLEELLEQDIIEKVTGPTPWVSPIVCIPKKDKQIRLCVDMRQANKAIIRERHPMPTIDDLLHEMNGAVMFSKLDLSQSFHQIELDVNSRDITTFITHKGLFRYKRLFFGVSCAPEIHQRIIQQVIGGCEGARNIADDIIIFGVTGEEHNRRLDAVLQRLWEAGLRLNRDKCQFGLPELTFMGYRLNKHGVSATDEKVRAVLNAREPRVASEVRSFLGLLNFVGRFLPDMSTVSAPLRDLTKTKTPWRWTSLERQAFEELKRRIARHSTLAYFSASAETRLVVDASPVGLGAVLLQRREGVFRPVEYASRSLTDVERRYSQTEREALAVVWGCERFHLYLYGIEFELVTDHKPLQAIYSPKSKPPARIERWVLRLQPYQFRVTYVPGKENIADSLSRLTQDPEVTSEDDSEDFIRFVAEHAVPATLAKRDIQLATSRDGELQAVLSCLAGGDWRKCPRPYKQIRHEICEYDGMLMRDRRIVIPATLRAQVLDLAHEGHQGIVRTKQRLRSKVWWPGIDADAEQRVKSCHACQVVSPGNPPEPVITGDLPSGPWEDLQLDLCGPFPSGEHLVVIVDKFSRWVEVEVLNVTTTEHILQSMEKSFACHGYPLSVTTDNARNLTSHVFEEYCRLRGIRHHTVTPLWPQANGGVERQNRTLLKAIRAAVAERRDWKAALTTFLMAYRSTPHPATTVSPAELMFGRAIRTKMPEVTERQPRPCGEQVRDSDTRYKVKAKMGSDRRRRAKSTRFNVGDLVLVKIPNKSTKLSGYFYPNPYVVTELKGTQVCVRRGDGKVFRRNKSCIKLFTPPHDDDDFLTPTTADVDPAVVPDVDSSVPPDDIAGQRTRSGRVVKKPQWFGDPVEH